MHLAIIFNCYLQLCLGAIFLIQRFKHNVLNTGAKVRQFKYDRFNNISHV